MNWLGQDRAMFVAAWPNDQVHDWLAAHDIEYQCLDFAIGLPCEGGTAFALSDDNNALLFRLWADDDTVEGPLRFNVVSETHEQEDPTALRAPARGRSSRYQD